MGRWANVVTGWSDIGFLRLPNFGRLTLRELRDRIPCAARFRLRCVPSRGNVQVANNAHVWTENERTYRNSENRAVGGVEAARAGSRLLPHYETCVQHGPERVHDLVPAGAATGFTKATVSAWRVSLEERGLGSSSIIISMSAIRKLAAEAADNGLLAPDLAQGISRAKSVKSTGIRVGNWLSQKRARATTQRARHFDRALPPRSSDSFPVLCF
jgi:hypothetical protein